MEIAALLERLAVFCLRRVDRKFSKHHGSRSDGIYASLFKYSSHVLDLARQGKLPFWRPEWEHDTLEQLTGECEPLKHLIDFKLLYQMGLSLTEIIDGAKSPIEVGMADKMLETYYKESIGMSTHTELMAKLVRQIAYRFPNMDILEIGAGTGSATKRILHEIKSAYNSYTFTDVSSGFFPAAQEELKDYGGFFYKVLDATQSPGPQGFPEHSYDLVVASMVLHTTPCLETTLRHARSLLKPGGYLVALEGQSHTNSRFGALFGAFPDWWAGSQDGRELTPFVDLCEWDKILKVTGFSGCDVTSPDTDSFVTPVNIFVSQAVDEKVSFLRSPVPFAAVTYDFPNGYLFSELVIIAGASSQTASLVRELPYLLEQYCGRIVVVRSWSELTAHHICSTATVLSLVDIDEPFLHNISNVEWESFRETLQEIGSLLWVTQGRLAGNPQSNMMLGLLRSALWEIPALDAQFLDFEDPEMMTARKISETLVRFQATKIWMQPNAQLNLLLSLEPEILVDEQGRELIPRLLPSEKMNNRYNSTRRQIRTEASLDTSVVELSSTNSGYTFLAQLGDPELQHLTPLRTSLSILSAVRITNRSFMFLSLGKHYKTSEYRVVLTTDHKSTLSPWENVSVATNIKIGNEARLLNLVLQLLVATAVIEGLEEGETILALEPTAALAAALNFKAKIIGVKVVCVTVDAQVAPSSWIRIHSAGALRTICDVLPKTASVFINCIGKNGRQPIVDLIRSHLPSSCRFEDTDTIFSNDSWIPRQSKLDGVKQMFKFTVECAERLLLDTDMIRVMAAPLQEAEALPQAKGRLAPDTIVNWGPKSNITVQVQPVASLISLSSTKTYWLAGPTRSLGLSLCEWLIRHGARFIALSSRHPVIDNLWLEHVADLGVSIKVLDWQVSTFTWSFSSPHFLVFPSN